MEKVQFNVPNLWADHHTLKVREVLTQQPGVHGHRRQLRLPHGRHVLRPGRHER